MDPLLVVFSEPPSQQRRQQRLQPLNNPPLVGFLVRQSLEQHHLEVSLEVPWPRRLNLLPQPLLRRLQEAIQPLRLHRQQLLHSLAMQVQLRQLLSPVAFSVELLLPLLLPPHQQRSPVVFSVQVARPLQPLLLPLHQRLLLSSRD
jgi:hypothetical protein